MTIADEPTRNRWIKQTKLHDPSNSIKGNCTEACIASILNIGIDEVIDMHGEAERLCLGQEGYLYSYHFWKIFGKFFELRGFESVMFKKPRHFKGFYIAYGPTTRENNLMHMVIFKDGHMYHDPHPSDAGITDVIGTVLIVPLDPSHHN